MDTVIVSNSQFYSHYPKRIPKGTVNAEAVLVRLDPEWDGLTVRIHWLNVASKVEKNPLLERDKPNTIPWEVLADLGELRMGLVGLDGETVIKPTIWLTYGYVVDGVDPESGSDPQPPTPSWEQQMVEQARVAAEAAEEAKDAAVNAEKAASQAGPYADEAQKSAEAAKEAQRAASTSAQEAGNSKDQANTAANAAKVHADAAGTAKVAAERAAETAGNAQSGAAKSAQTAANSAKEAERAKQEAQKAAATLPSPSPEVAGKVPTVNQNGNGYIFGEASGGELLLAEYIHQGNQEIQPASIDWESAIIECIEPHGLSEATEVFLIPNKSESGSQIENIRDLPAEWVGYSGSIYVIPLTETSLKVVGADKESPISVNSGAMNNTQISVEKFHFETKTRFSITNLNASPKSLRFEILAYSQIGYFSLSLNSDSGQFYLTSPAFSPVTLYNNKSYHGYLHSLSIEVGIFNGMYTSWYYSSGLAKALSYARNAFWAAISSGSVQLTNADNKTIRKVNSFSALAGGNTLHNGGVVRVWGRRAEE